MAIVSVKLIPSIYLSYLLTTRLTFEFSLSSGLGRTDASFTVEKLMLRNNLGNNKDQEENNSRGQQSDNAKEFNREFVDYFFRRFLYTSQSHKRNRCTILFLLRFFRSWSPCHFQNIILIRNRICI